MLCTPLTTRSLSKTASFDGQTCLLSTVQLILLTSITSTVDSRLGWDSFISAMQMLKDIGVAMLTVSSATTMAVGCSGQFFFKENYCSL